MLTMTTWIFERVKIQLQTHPELTTEGSHPPFFRAFTHIVDTQGQLGLYRGLAPKTLSNAIFVIGADYFLEIGREGSRASSTYSKW